MSPGTLLVVAALVSLQADTANKPNSNNKNLNGARFMVYCLFSHRFVWADHNMASPCITSQIEGR